MASRQHTHRSFNPQLLIAIGRKLRGRFMLSGDALLSAGLRYGLLTFYVALVYVLVLAVGGVTNAHIVLPWWLILVAVLVVVPTFLPVHSALRRSINQLVYGQRDNSYALLAHLNQSLDA